MHTLSGPVTQGKKLGRTLGFPTINVQISHIDALAGGTWHVHVLIDGTIYRGLGPYFPERNLFEVHVLNFNETIYDKEVTILPIKKIRENEQFGSLTLLREQISLDKKQVAQTSITGISFGTFDLFHEGHIAYLKQAHQRCDILVCVVALDETVVKVKGHKPTHNALQRKKKVEEANIVEHVILGDAQDHYSCLQERQPNVICLGYDQDSFTQGLQEFYTGQGQALPTLVRLESFKPEIYKSSLLKKNN